jgi:ABC-type dipeptide/oligopeptide/nickel transport system permease subunit
MGSFLRENWIWIVAPIVLVLILVLAMVYLSAGDDSPFAYNIF